MKLSNLEALNCYTFPCNMAVALKWTVLSNGVLDICDILALYKRHTLPSNKYVIPSVSPNW